VWHFFAQERWLRVNPEHNIVMRSLPIFYAANLLGSPDALTTAQLVCLPSPALMAPSDMPGDTLPDCFVAAHRGVERAALQCLGVRSLKRSEALRCVLDRALR
jgi:hypothetical protein